MFIEAHPRPLGSPQFTSAAFLPTDHCPPITPHFSPKSLPFNLFAGPHPLNPYAAIFYKNSGGSGPLPIFRRSRVETFGRADVHCSHKFFRCNTYESPASVAYKRLTVWLNSLDATLTKNQGGYILQAKCISLSFLHSGESKFCRRSRSHCLEIWGTDGNWRRKRRQRGGCGVAVRDCRFLLRKCSVSIPLT